VRLDEPSWWYAQRQTGLATCLKPLAAVYGYAAARRYHRTSPYRSRLPVVCVGNFTAGGTGKTPLVMHLCERLAAAGHAPVALSRGYGGRLAGPYWVNAASDLARDVGDEALLLARVAPTLIARDRRAGARAIETGPHPVTAIVMDDGLQNPGLAKSLAFAVVDGSRGLGNGLVMPAGPLRAALDFQLGLTDAIVVNEGVEGGGSDGSVTEWLRRRFAGPVLRARLVPSGESQWLKGARVLAWAGIGAPERFFATLRAMGAELAHTVAFRDHQPLRPGDARRLLDLAHSLGAAPVTTEKDVARLAGAQGACAELAAITRAVAVRVVLEEPDAERLASLLASALKSGSG
jgi:tetraacyldisaccharide 4'-kinase